MKPPKRYLVRVRNFLGTVRRGWGNGTAASYGPWRTVAALPTLEGARTYVAEHPAVRLRQWRILYGGKVLSTIQHRLGGIIHDEA
jgi:hypothetical protein